MPRALSTSMRFLIFLVFLATAGMPVLLGQKNPPPGVEANATIGSATATTIPATAPGSDVPLTISQALALAEKNSPILKQADASVAGAKAGVETAKAYTNPSFDFMGGNQSARPISIPGIPGVLLHYSVTQTIEVPAERSTRLSAAKLDLIARKYQSMGIRLSVAATVKRAFYDVIRRKEQLANANDNLTLVEDLRRRVSLEVQVGEIGRLELTRAEAELARAHAAVRSADVQLAYARAMLKAVIGSELKQTLDAQGSLGEAVEVPALNELRHQVLTHHPALSEANTLTTRSRKIVEHERALRIPQPTFYGEYEHQPDLTFYRLGVSVPLPLWDRRKGPIHEAKAAMNSSEAVAMQRRLEITAALESAYDQYQISNQQVAAMQAGSLKEAEAAVEAARAAYRFGERGIVEVLDAQRVLQGVRSDLLEALYARRSALIDLEELGVNYK